MMETNATDEKSTIISSDLLTGETSSGIRKLLLQLAMFHFAMAGISLIVTGNISLLKGVYFLLLPSALILRVMTLVLFTFPVCFTPYRRTLLMIMSALWMLWQGFSCGRFIEASVMAAVIAGVGITVFFFSERTRPSGHDVTAYWFKKLSFILYFSLLFIFLIEILQTGSFLIPVKSMLTQPDILGVNLLLFTALGSFVIWIRRPAMGAGIYLVFWLVFGIASLIKNANNFEPVLIPDIFQIKEGLFALADILGIFWLILLFVAIAGLIAGLIVLGLKMKKRERAGRGVVAWSLGFMAVGIIAGVLASFLPWINFSERSPRELFNRNGYVFSFVTTGYRVLKLKPDNYKFEELEPVLENVRNAGKDSKDAEKGKMNIIVLQIESFIDPTELEGMEYERDPIPFLHSLKENYTHGKVVVPIFGGQTVKSEFEFLTGFSINNLPFGYNPYMIHVDDTAVDSLPRYLKSLGFDTFGMHDYQGEFFSRNSVYKNLGFDYFVPYEFMSGVQKKEQVIWADDSILLEQMKIALDNSDKDKHFVFAVTVQTHGAYPSLKKTEYPMEIKGLELKSKTEGQLAYYISQLEQVDTHLRNLVDYFEQRGEPTVIVMYSDHMPTFARELPGITDENRFNVNFYTWNNMGLPNEEYRSLYLYQLSTLLCDSLGLDGSFMNRFHRLYKDDENYVQYFEKTQYYKLFEETQEVEYTNPGFTYGLVEPKITDIIYDEELNEYTVKGQGMTDDTYLCVNGRIYNMIYVDSGTMKYTSPKRLLTPEDTVTLRIIGEKYGAVLRESEVYEWG